MLVAGWSPPRQRRTLGSAGTPADGPACYHFVYAVTYIAEVDPAGALSALEPMLAAAERDGERGWQACALASRATAEIDPLTGIANRRAFDRDEVSGHTAAAIAA